MGYSALNYKPTQKKDDKTLKPLLALTSSKSCVAHEKLPSTEIGKAKTVGNFNS